MKKHLLIAASLAALLASCTSEVIPERPSAESFMSPIEFIGEPGAMTRAENITGAAAATLLSNKFVVYGQKTVNSEVSQVFEGVPVEYTTEWSYVSASQALRYWDSNASSYNFYAYSDANNPSIVTPESNIYTGGVTIATSTAENLSKVYITPVQNISTSAFTSPVTFAFKSAAAKVRVAFYNAIPGYEVNVDKFYVTTSDAETENTTLKGSFYQSASYTIAANGTQSVNGTPTTMADLTLGNKIVQCTNANQYIGKSITTATFDKDGGAYTWVLPTQGAVQDINLKVTYRMISGHDVISPTVDVKIPAVYAKWEPNHAYTYYFKITDNDRHPITFDAEVVNFETNETITTIDNDNPVNITTWVADSDVKNDDVYKKGKDIYVSVANCPNTTFDVHYGFTTDETINGSNAGSKIADNSWNLLTVTTNGRYQINATAAGYYVVRVSWTSDSTTKYAYKVIKVVD